MSSSLKAQMRSCSGATQMSGGGEGGGGSGEGKVDVCGVEYGDRC